MKKVVFIVLEICLLYLVLMPVQLRAQRVQEIEVIDDYVRLASESGSLKLFKDGDLVYNLYNTRNWRTGFVSNVNNDTQKGLVVHNNGAVAFIVYGDGTVEANGVALHSDSTLKEGISDMDNQLEKLKKLKGVTYHLKRDKAKDGKKKKTHYGLLSQDVEKIYPDMVFTNEEGIKSIFYTELIPVLLEAVKTQQAQIESQNKQLLDIEKRLAKLELMKSK
ncbi:MAG: tail fiber domain-containing protein [Prolixibacteraceae bacterium]|nr:tail fiber domain-containing protein [Prolixibacteraceae bacterium]